jgi:transcriptional regulator with XRE-family HTH domain
MKIQDIPAFMGRSAAALAADFGIPKQTLGQYLNGQRGKPSRLITDLLIFCNLNREEIIFPDRFDHPDGENPESPVYWANVALEALHEATKRGLPEQDAERIAESIRQVIAPMLGDISG